MHSLNVAAKDFIPFSTVDKNSSNGFYPYTIHYEIPRDNFTTNVLSNVGSFLTGKTLVPDCMHRVDADYLLDFATSNFRALYHNNDLMLRGFFLSKENLQIPEVGSCYTEACGVLVPLNVDERSTILLFLHAAWRKFFSSFRGADGITGIGYIRHNVSPNMFFDKVADKHFFFVTCSKELESDVLININTFTKLSKMPFERSFIVKSIAPFLFSPQAPLCVVATVGEKQFDPIVNMYKKVYYSPSSASSTYESLKTMEEAFFECLKNGCVSVTRFIFYIHVRVYISASGLHAISIDDVIRFIGNMCNRAFVSFCGVSFENLNAVPGAEKLFHLNPSESFYVLKSLSSLIYAPPINMSVVTLGDIPGWITVPLETEVIEKGIAAYSKYVLGGKVKGQDEIFLSHGTIYEAATNLATKPFKVCRRTIGKKILVGTLAENKFFGIDVQSASIFGLPFCFGWCSDVPPGCLFVSTLAPVQNDISEFRILIEDILEFSGTDVSNYSFNDRWEYVKEIEMDQYSWPHSSPLHLIALRSRYEPLCMLEPLIGTREWYSTFGFQLRCLNEAHTTYSWIPRSSITAKFAAEKIIKNSDCFRIYLKSYDNDGTLISYHDEYTESGLECFPHLVEGDVIECLLRTNDDDSHWWDLINVLGSRQEIYSVKEVDELVHYRGLNENELLKLACAPAYVCAGCKKVNDAGHLKEGKYMCPECWKATGYGDCVLCNRELTVGSVDRISSHFYCNQCQENFSRINSSAELGYHVPPPPNATLTQQVKSRCISILIDSVNSRGPTNDVLELCSGGAVPRKWVKNKTMEYIGIDINEHSIAAQQEAVNRACDLPEGSSYTFLNADAFSEKFWMEELAPRHPNQFQTITCFSGFHHVFHDEEICRHFIARVANALLPGGLFLGIFIDANEIFQKGKKFTNKVFSVEWEEGALPRIGNTFSLACDGQPERKMNVVPTDFLVAVGETFNLKPISKVWKSFQEIIEIDPKWTMALNTDISVYLGALRVFAFKKDSEFVVA